MRPPLTWYPQLIDKIPQRKYQPWTYSSGKNARKNISGLDQGKIIGENKASSQADINFEEEKSKTEYHWWLAGKGIWGK